MNHAFRMNDHFRTVYTLLVSFLTIGALYLGCRPNGNERKTQTTIAEKRTVIKRSHMQAIKKGEKTAEWLKTHAQQHMLDTFQPAVPDEELPHAPALLTFSPIKEANAYAWTRGASQCATCHSEEEKQWRKSAHHYASFQNPWYRAVVDRFREKVGHEHARFCSGCHDPALLATGAVEQPITAQTEHIFAGITCVTCHRATDVKPEGNGALTLSLGKEVAIAKQDIPRHKSRMNPDTLEASKVCTACHRGVLTPETGNHHSLVGMDDVTAWQRSIWAGHGLRRIDAVESKDCIGCHMYPGERSTPTHLMPGAHTALARGRGDEKHLAALRQFLREDSVYVHIMGVRDVDGRWTYLQGLPLVTSIPPQISKHPENYQPAIVDIIVENRGVGHRFPGGTLDLQDTWLEVVVRDRHGTIVAANGLLEDKKTMETAVFRLQAMPINKAGEAMRRHQTEDFRTFGWNHTILPRDVRVARYELSAEQHKVLHKGGSIDVHLNHRRHSEILRQWVCKQSRTNRGQAFQQAFLALGGQPADPCTKQPLTVLDTDSVTIGTPKDSSSDHDTLLWKYAEGLSNALQDDLGEALEVIRLQRAGLSLDATESARLTLLEAEIRGRLSQTQRALELIARVGRTVDSPVLDYRRARALTQTWKWERAAKAARKLTDRQPEAELGWLLLAQAAASSGNRMEALNAAWRGLALQPRSPTFLRIQLTSMRLLLESGDPRIETANRAFRRFREDEEAKQIQAECFKRERCRVERMPLSVRPLIELEDL